MKNIFTIVNTPSSIVCKGSGGKIDSSGICIANWEDAKKICSASGGQLPNMEELTQVVVDCGGTITRPHDKDRASLSDKNYANTSYRLCYKAKGFASNYYWSSSTSTAWGVNFDGGRQGYGNKLYNYYVRCVRAGQ